MIWAWRAGRGVRLTGTAALIGAIGLAAAGCVTETPAEQAAMQQDAARPVTCQGQQDCEVKWGRALQWVLNTSAYKIDVQSDVPISTLGPLPQDPRPAITVDKVALGEGRYSFDLRAGCDNIFGCVPSLLSLKADFVRAVMGPSGG